MRHKGSLLPTNQPGRRFPRLEANAVRNEAVTDVHEVAEDAAPTAKSLADMEEDVSTADSFVIALP